MRKEVDPSLHAGGRRVILGVSCYLDAKAALTLAVALAGELQADLHGLFVWDQTFLGKTARMRHRVVSYSGTPLGTVTASDMTAAFQADSRHFQRQLENRAKAAALTAAYQEFTGHLPEAVQQTAKGGDFVVYGFSSLRQPGTEIALVLEENQSPPGYARRLAEQLGKTLVILRVHGAVQEGLLPTLERMSPAATVLAAPATSLPPVSRILEAVRSPIILPDIEQP